MRDKKNLVVVKNDLGYLVYDEERMDGIDVFADDHEGKERLIQFGLQNYGVDLSKKL